MDDAAALHLAYIMPLTRAVMHPLLSISFKIYYL